VDGGSLVVGSVSVVVMVYTSSSDLISNSISS